MIKEVLQMGGKKKGSKKKSKNKQPVAVAEKKTVGKKRGTAGKRLVGHDPYQRGVKRLVKANNLNHLTSDAREIVKEVIVRLTNELFDAIDVRQGKRKTVRFDDIRNAVLAAFPQLPHDTQRGLVEKMQEVHNNAMTLRTE